MELSSPQYCTDDKKSGPIDFSSFKSLRKLVTGCVFLFGQRENTTVSDWFVTNTDMDPIPSTELILRHLPLGLEELSITQFLSIHESERALTCLEAVMHSKKNKLTRLRFVEWRCPGVGEGRHFLRLKPEAVTRMRELAKLTAAAFVTLIEEPSLGAV